MEVELGMKKQWIRSFISVMLLSVLFLTSCSGSGDGADYVKGILDIAYNKGTESYVKATDVKEEEAKKYTQQSLEAEAKVMAAYFGIEEPSEQVIASFQEFCKKLFASISYKVEAKGDKVQISVNQMTIGNSEALQKYVEEFNIKQFVDGDESCTDEAFAKGVTEVLNKELEAGTCGTKDLTIEVTITEKDGKYSISDDELKKIEDQMVVYQ